MKAKKIAILFFLSMVAASIFAEEIVLANTQEFKIRKKSLLGKQVCVEGTFICLSDGDEILSILIDDCSFAVPEESLTESFIKQLASLDGFVDRVKVHGIVTDKYKYVDDIDTVITIEVSKIEVLPKPKLQEDFLELFKSLGY